MWRRAVLSALSLATVAVVVGCGTRTQPPAVAVGEETQETKPQPVGKPDEHAHKPGAHGGTIVEIGRDNYHAEVVIETGGVFRLYTLGKDEAKIQEVEQQKLTAYVKQEEGGEHVPVTLRPQPQEGDAPGKTSLFVGQLPQQFWGKNLSVTINNFKIAGERFRLGFTYAGAPHDGGMPASVAGTDGERHLFLTPGGLYTAADIKANGSVPASEKYKDFRSAHDLRPKAGEKICPVTMTKANPQCTWIVGGKTYEFCCPPCIEEFVRTAKEAPAEVKPPEEYRK